MIALSHRPAYAFAGGTLDRASELREDAAAIAKLLDHGRFLPISADHRIPVASGRVAWLERRALAGANASPERIAAHASFLGLQDGVGLFAWPLLAGEEIAQEQSDEATLDRSIGDATSFVDLRTAAGLLDDESLAVAAFARALLHWQSRKRFCGRCGAATIFDQSGHRAKCSDASCAQQYFPRTDPAIIVLVTHGDRCLLGRQPSWPEKRFSTLAGFVEPGETLEKAVAREVREESGVIVEAAAYVASQPWPFPAALMVGFEARASSDAIQCGAEIAEARWFTAEQLKRESEAGELKLSPKLSIAFHLIERWYRAQTGEEIPPGPDWRRG